MMVFADQPILAVTFIDPLRSRCSKYVNVPTGKLVLLNTAAELWLRAMRLCKRPVY